MGPLPSTSLVLSANAFVILRDLIQERTGLYYDEGKRDMLSYRLSPRVLDLGLGSFLDYYYLLKYDAGAAGEWQQVMDALSVQETFFWREADQVRALVNRIVPEFAARAGGQPLRIWSAGCATGEEPLTLAMALEEAGWFGRLPIEIRASDASPSAIARARRGVYRERSFRALSPALREKYFMSLGDTWQAIPQLQSRVQWTTANLMSEVEVAELSRAPVIYCRNVFIYFSEDAVRRVAASFYRHMPAPGYLFVGASESLLRVATGFSMEEIDTAFAYVKR